MPDLGINAENFNPQVLYTVRAVQKNHMKTSYHCHDYIEISCILSGAVIYNIENNIYHLKKGDILPFNAGMYHEEKLMPGEEVTELHIGIYNLPVKGLPKNHILPSGISPVIRLQKYEQEFFNCCSEIIEEQKKGEPCYELVLKSLVMKLVAILLKEVYYKESILEGSGFSMEYSERANIVNQIVSYMNQNYMKNISLDKIARNMYLSPVYISKIFKEETGESPINHLINLRLSKAKEMLEEGHLPIKAVAKTVGYNDVYHFSKLFKKYYGCSPKEYKTDRVRSRM